MSEKLESRIIGSCPSHTKIGKDMTWPSYDQGDLEWILRYGNPDQIIEVRMILASIVSAYKSLIAAPSKRRNQICDALFDAALPTTKE